MIGSIDLVRWRIATYGLIMKSLLDVPNELWRAVRAVGFDIDDTVTTDGRVTAEAYSAMWALKEAGFRVLAVTGRPAGWCDMIARTWPVDGVLGENGALFFRRVDQIVSRYDLGRRLRQGSSRRWRSVCFSASLSSKSPAISSVAGLISRSILPKRSDRSRSLERKLWRVLLRMRAPRRRSLRSTSTGGLVPGIKPAVFSRFYVTTLTSARTSSPTSATRRTMAPCLRLRR